MYDWIELDGIKSNALLGVAVLEWIPPLYTRRKRDTTWIPGRIDQIQSKYPTYEEPVADITLAIVADDEAGVQTRWLTIRKWLAHGRRLRLSDQPNNYYVGEITQATLKDNAIYESGLCWLTANITFALCPACILQYRSAKSGWCPDLDTPIPQQLTAANATQSKAFTVPGNMAAVTYDGAYPAWLCLKVTGTWTKLNLGGGAGLTINQAATKSTTLYIDCAAQVTYALEANQQVSWAGTISGDYPTPTQDFALAVGGTEINVTVQLLVIEMT